MANLQEVTITEVTKENLVELWPCITDDIKNASFIAVDAEMSGLGSKTMNVNIDERYAELCAAADTRSIISLGLSCFKAETSEDGQNVKCCVTVYNILLLCSEPYTIDPKAVQFLTQHGFNFNKQFSLGIPYYKGNDKEGTNFKTATMRNLFGELLRQRKPLVLHNGLTDLIFMYQSFYAESPPKLAAFMADLSEMFPAGIYDTKYIAEFSDHASASFLLFVFKMACLKNANLQESGHVSLDINFSSKNKWSVANSLTLPSTDLYAIASRKQTIEVCERYSAYGWCRKGESCTRSHDIDSIILFHLQSKPRGRKRKKPSSNSQNEDPDLTVDHIASPAARNDLSDNSCLKSAQQKSPVDDSSTADSHRSGLDAFMTGYTFAMFIVANCKREDIITNCNSSDMDVKEFSSAIPFLRPHIQKTVVNQLFLSGKSMPLQVCKSQFTKSSKNHTEKLIRVYMET